MQAIRIAEATLRTGSADPAWRVSFLTLKATAENAAMRYRQALASAVQARDLAAAAKRPLDSAVASALIASLYSRFGQRQLAADEARRAARDLPADAPPRYAAGILLSLGPTLYQSGERTAGEELFERGAAVARTAGLDRLLAPAHSRMALHRLRAGDYAGAERHLSQALPLYQKAGSDAIESWYHTLARLRLAQDRPAEALPLLDKALQAARPGASRTPLWSVYYHRALARRRLGDLHRALEDFALSAGEIGAWREDAFAAEEAQNAVAAGLSPVFAAYVECGMSLYLQNGSEALARRMLHVAEEGRSAAMMTGADWQARVPSRYWDVLGAYRAARAAWMADKTSVKLRKLRNLSTQLTQLESQVGIATENFGPGQSLIDFRRKLKPQEILISFFVGKDRSWAWCIGRHTFEVRQLPGARELDRLTLELREAVQRGAGAERAAARLFRAVFAPLRTAASARAWVLVPDGVLYDVPFAALHDGLKWSVESRSIRILPSAWMAKRRPAAPRQTLLGLGDPVYNAADPRFRGDRAAGGLHMARIPASATELRTVASAWAGPRRTLIGNEIGHARLAQELKKRPAVLHAATHVVGDEQGLAVMALGYGGGSSPAWWDAVDVARLPASADLVVLSGCHSAQGRVLPGVGLTGLTRAWLLAGATSVVASHWAVPDDAGGIWGRFYGELRDGSAARSSARAAEALRAAQAAMLRSGGERANPRYWAAYFVVGRN